MGFLWDFWGGGFLVLCVFMLGRGGDVEGVEGREGRFGECGMWEARCGRGVCGELEGEVRGGVILISRVLEF